MKNTVRSEDAAEYKPAAATVALRSLLDTAYKKTEDDAIIRRAIEILTARLERTEAWSADALTSPEATVNLLRLRVATLPYEVFGCLFLDNRHRMICAQELFRGTIDGASVHPREVVREAMAHNAAAVVLYHNHPSWVAEPSQADMRITQRLKDALALVGVRVLDHIVIGGTMEYASFAERGIL